ncbi:MAG: hypothetical protein IM650_11330 [Phenylobacterium sp.]|uniref:hypothetical protein n=1 Tax=Phenylobacterium sp. TaxID=1871053 RepID=UPI0025FBC798|nr:hypothetical protein [Phenylobacterium sp.]MCA6258672.1 hypothetical protein [Phenylobacterium sp.]MCA6264153.1 hypothetical protein [Phenylobacterium sp.]MCA6269135.1 hypothetical protein [Phenylobacterium sp.]MCA6281383.1 hypothetical protein [Phenylobacterium sp.]MCA6301210.1 hypothetical protein [Phenylobacterium sp.]
MKAAILSVQNAALCFVRKWWRPMVQIGIGGSLLVNGVVVPLLTKTYPDLTGLAACIVAAAPFAAIRAWEKAKGTTAVD